MALETLRRAEQQAADLMQVDFDELLRIQESNLVLEGTLDVDGTRVQALRAHSGGTENPLEDELIGKGGVRAYHYDTPEEARKVVKELSEEMLLKLAIRGMTNKWKGAKGLINVNAKGLTVDQIRDVASQFEGLMESKGLASPREDVPAPDVGIPAAFPNAYMIEYMRKHPTDAEGAGCITGKSPDYDGLKGRTEATGLGSAVMQRVVMDYQDIQRASTAIQGFGNVGGWHGRSMSDETVGDGRMWVSAISDTDGILYTKDPAGIEITEAMMREIGDQPSLSLKIHRLAGMVESNQKGLKFDYYSDPSAILYCPVDYLVPAAMGNALTADNVRDLGARRGIIEAANGPTTAEAHRYLVAAVDSPEEFVVMSDVAANGAGVRASTLEHQVNTEGIDLSHAEVRQMLIRDSRTVGQNVLRAADRLGTNDMRVAAVSVGIANLLKHRKPMVYRELLAMAA